MPAYLQTPLTMREHLASLTNGTRFIGGSADTMYIPGRHRDAFMDVLGLFLDTDCFLEIATPTALHLVSPPGEPILYVDHVRPFLLFVSVYFLKTRANGLCHGHSGGSGSRHSTRLSSAISGPKVSRLTPSTPSTGATRVPTVSGEVILHTSPMCGPCWRSRLDVRVLSG
jgi:hypothetical protein